MIENFAQNYDFSKEQTIGKDATPSYEDFTNKILPAMFGNVPYIRVTYNTDLKDFEQYKFHRKKPQKGLWLENVMQPNLAAALWYRVNPVWLKYCENYMKSYKPAYVILSQIKNRNLRFCIARIAEFHSFTLVYQDIEKNKELFDLAQNHEFLNNHNQAWYPKTPETSLEIDKVQKRQMIMFVPTQTQILTLNNISPIDVELAKKAKSVKNTAFIEKIPTLTHSYLPIKVNEFGTISVGSQKIFSTLPAQKLLFLLALLGKKYNNGIFALNTTTLKQIFKIYPYITDVHPDRLLSEAGSIIKYGNLRKDIGRTNETLNKYLPTNMYHITHEFENNIMFEKEFNCDLITIDSKFYDKIKSQNP
jgi:hypothetical protein